MAKKKAVKRILRTANVYDESGSMRGIADKVLTVANRINEVIEKEAKDTPSRVTLIKFSNNVHVLLEDQDPVNLRELTRKDYNPDNGMTALFKAVKVAIDSLSRFGGPDDIYLVNVFTDGVNNIGRHLVRGIVEEMKYLEAKGNWTFTFQMPKEYRETFIQTYNISPGNVEVWEATEKGAEKMEEQTSAGVSNFYQGVRGGATQSKGFFVQPDLAKVTKKDLKSLTDLSAKFKSYEVDKETPIKEFVEAKTKKGYVIGSTYYALTKKEKVQPQKEILLLDIRDNKIYGGDEARGLIGLPQGIHAEVVPGNHGNFIIYVKSTSVNRKLVRGTKILVDTTKIANDDPTWDHSKLSREPAPVKKAPAKKRTPSTKKKPVVSK